MRGGFYEPTEFHRADRKRGSLVQHFQRPAHRLADVRFLGQCRNVNSKRKHKRQTKSRSSKSGARLANEERPARIFRM